MKLNTAAKKIKKGLKKSKATTHFNDKVIDRELNDLEIKESMRKFNLIGITYQGSEKYQIILEYTKEKDLNIVLSLNQRSNVSLITIFPSSSERRLK